MNYELQKSTSNKKIPFLLLNILHSHIPKKELRVSQALPSPDRSGALLTGYSRPHNLSPSSGHL